MIIRRMLAKDLEAIVPLAFQLGYQVNLDDLKTRFQKMDTSNEYALFVAESNETKVVGYIQVNLEPYTLLRDQRANIAALVVDEHYRKQRIGTALLNIASTWAKKNGVKSIRLRSNIKRVDAHRFYLREGFETSKTSHIFTKSI